MVAPPRALVPVAEANCVALTRPSVVSSPSHSRTTSFKRSAAGCSSLYLYSMLSLRGASLCQAAAAVS